jgi:hypothetical protein
MRGSVRNRRISQMGIKAEPFVATGGSVTIDGDYTVHTFTSDGFLTVSQGSADVEYLIIGAGAGGGASNGGGGGAGDRKTGTMFVHLTTPVIVGLGGVKGTWPGSPNGQVGGSSSFGSVVADGGGPGQGESAAYPVAGANGGGGPGFSNSNQRTGRTGSTGRKGGDGMANTSPFRGGGGAGAGTDGKDGSAVTNPGYGGDGIASAISGTNTYYQGGGAAGNVPAGTGGGLGGGAPAGGTPTANTGSGGCGGPNAASGSDGAKGIVILRYRTQS